jgi:hypothetical protein
MRPVHLAPRVAREPYVRGSELGHLQTSQGRWQLVRLVPKRTLRTLGEIIRHRNQTKAEGGVRRAGWEGLLGAYQKRRPCESGASFLELRKASSSPRRDYSDSTSTGSR